MNINRPLNTLYLVNQVSPILTFLIAINYMLSDVIYYVCMWYMW